MRSATRMLIVVLSALSLALPLAGAASADEVPVVVAEVTETPATPGAETAPAGPDLETETEESQADSKRKLVMGIASAVLLGIVIWGHSVRRKRAKAK